MEYKMHSPVGEYEVQEVVDAYQRKLREKEE